MRFAVIFLLLLSVTASAKKPEELTESDLKNLAEQELSSTPSGAVLKPFSLPEENDGLVSTAEAVREEEQEPLPSSEFELGGQPYRPVGQGRISASENYSYGALSEKPMLLLGGHYWFYQRLLSQRLPWRAGIAVQGGLASHLLKITTNQGRVYDDSRLNTLQLMAGPEVEFFVWRHWLAAGLGGKVGRTFVSQSTRSTIMDHSQAANLWEAGLHVRVQPWRSVFARISVAKRGVLGTAGNLGAQENNYSALIGFGM